MIPKIQAFLFDLDGTLIDTEKLYVQAVKKSLADRECRLTNEEAIQLVYGKGWFDVFYESRERFPHAYSDVESMALAVRNHFMDLRSQIDVRITSSIELLIQLSQNNPVAIVSGSYRQEIMDSIAMMGIESHLQFFLGAEDYSPGKPAPICYLMAAEKLALQPCQCLVFEDSYAGVQAAKDAGMYCVGLQRNGAPRQDLSRADWIVSDLFEFDFQQFMD